MKRKRTISTSQEKEFKKTLKQKEAIKLLSSDAKNTMLYGGSRSGKTFIILYAIIVRASKCLSRHLILREKFNHVKTSVWLDTLPKVFKICFPDLPYQENKSDYYITLPNGSEIWIGGLDSKERTEKVLGKEYSTIFFNECSQLTFTSVEMAKTRLAELNILKKKLYYDENPPTRRHWSYWTFIKHWHPADEKELNPNQYRSMLINPIDNIDNIDEDYIPEILSQLSQKQRDRFEFGLFTDSDDGEAYYEFDRETHVKEFDRPLGRTFIGQDFNVDPMASTLAGVINGVIYVFDEVFQRNSDTYKLAKEIKRKQLPLIQFIPDSTGKNRKTSGKSDFQILKDEFGDNCITYTRNPFVTDRVNNINRMLRDGLLFIHPRCKKLINDLEKVSWKGNELDQKTDKLLTHSSDSLGYICWTLFPMTGVNNGIVITKR